MRTLKISFRLTLILLAFSFYKQFALPVTLKVHPSCLAEPVQSPARKAPFQITMRGVTYTVRPMYAYDISGLIPTVRQYTKWPRGNFYERHGDTANIADVALLWGRKNTDRSLLKHFKFAHSGPYVAWHTRLGVERSTWMEFRQNKISNNHILTDSKELRRRFEKLRYWDQVRMKGWLVSYSGGTTRNRTSSTVRTDSGNGACEVFYVEDLEILKKSSTRVWALVHKISWGLLAGLSIVYMRRPVSYV